MMGMLQSCANDLCIIEKTASTAAEHQVGRQDQLHQVESKQKEHSIQRAASILELATHCIPVHGADQAQN